MTTISSGGYLTMQSPAGAKRAANASTSQASTSVAAPSARDEFLDYMKLTPAQRMEQAILEEMGLTKEDLESMPPEQRKAIEETIRERIKAKMEEAGDRSKGKIADLTV